MKNSDKNVLMPDFSHIYLEKQVRDHPVANRIMAKFPRAVVVEIDHYKDVFNRSRQQFSLQKQSQKLILAEKKGQLVYPGADVSQDFGHEHFYYTSTILNCVYDCHYCYLQGMFPSANIVMFVNMEDFFAEVDRLLIQHPVYLAISYDTDLLAFENIAGMSRMWIEYVRKQPDLIVELRTKSVNYGAIRDMTPVDRVVLAWTLSPPQVAKVYEPLTPSPRARLQSIKQAIDDGWKVRLSFDPVLNVKDWRRIYGEWVEETFSVIPPEQVEDISIGVFRMSKDYLKNIRRVRTDSPLVYENFTCRDGVYSYPEPVTSEMTDYVRGKVRRFVPEEKIFL